MKNFKLMKGIIACLLSLVLVATSITSTGAHAEEQTTVVKPNPVSASYVPDNDTVSAAANSIVYVLKKEKGNTVKKGAKCYTISSTAADNTLLAIGVKGTTKDTYLYVCDREFEETATGINANLVIKGQAAKKIAGVIDYTKVDTPTSTDVLSINATDSSKKKIEGAQLIWSADGDTWKQASDYTGAVLKKDLEAGATIQVKMIGTASPAVRTSKAVKVKIAKEGKAPTVKVDVKKDTFGIKNGMDFAFFTKNGEDYTLVGGWNTVLPVLKTAQTKTLAESIVSTANAFKPVDKKDASANKKAADNSGKVSYTAAKIKAVGYDTLLEKFNAAVPSPASNTDYYIGVRNSATAKKPASAVTYFKFVQKTNAPIVYTESNVNGQFLIASGTGFDKKGFVLGTIANYNGATGTSGYDDSFTLKASQTDADTAAESYEFAIVNKDDWNYTNDGNPDTAAIDWSSVSWKKLDPAKTKINAKLKTKYNTVAKTGITATLSAATKAAEITASNTEKTQADIPDEVKTIMLIRRAGVKGKTADEAVVASEIIPIFVLKDGKNYEIYSTVANGEVAYKYTVEFYRWSLSGEGTSATYEWVKDDSLTVTGWGNGSNENPEFPAVENADFFELGANNTIAADATKITLNNNKWTVAVPNNDGITKKVAIREYANVKVVGVGSDSGVPVANSDFTIASITNGKVATYNSASKSFSVAANTDVTAYVGSSLDITVEGYNVPTGYETVAGDRTVADGTGYTKATGAKVESNKITVTINTAEEVTIKVNEPVIPKYAVSWTAPSGATVTVKNGSSALTSGDMVKKGTSITVEVSATVLKSVKINGTVVNATENKASTNIDVNSTTVISITDLVTE